MLFLTVALVGAVVFTYALGLEYFTNVRHVLPRVPGVVYVSIRVCVIAIFAFLALALLIWIGLLVT